MVVCAQFEMDVAVRRGHVVSSHDCVGYGRVCLVLCYGILEIDRSDQADTSGSQRYIFWRFGHDLSDQYRDLSVAKVIPTYLSLFIFGFIYQLFLTYDALRLKNTIQIIGLCIYNLGLTIEAAVQYDQIRDARDLASQPIYQHGTGEYKPDPTEEFVEPDFWPSIKPFAIALPIFLGVICFLLGFITWKLNDEFAWSIYKHISADLRLKRRYLSYQVSCESPVRQILAPDQSADKGLDLRCFAQIRFLLLPRVYSPISRHCSPQHGTGIRRVLAYGGRCPLDGRFTVLGRILDAKGECVRHAYHSCEYSAFEQVA